MQRNGLRIVFVPTCLVPSKECWDWRRLFEFTVRQIKITRIYAPEIWKLSLATYTLFNLTIFCLLWKMFVDPIALVLLLLIYTLAVIRSAVLLIGARVADSQFGYPSWFYLLSAPLVSCLYQFSFVASAMNRNIHWKGVSYEMISKSETRRYRS